MSRARKRADRIRELIPLATVLADYGYSIESGYDGEQQFSCDLHGDGSDNKPSARLYGDSNSAYCFACDRTRDSIEYVREKEGIEFWEAVKKLEERHGLPRLPWDDEDQADWEERKSREIKAIDEVATTFNPDKTFDEDRHRLFRLLDGFTLDRDLPFRTLASLWEAYDKIVYLVFKEQLTEKAGQQGLLRIRERAMEKIGVTA